MDDAGSGYFNSLIRKSSRKSQRQRARVRILLRYCAGGRLLEVGCGLGAFLEAARPYFEVEGLEHSGYATQVARERLGAVVRQADIQAVELESGAYGAAAAFNVLEHLREPARALRTIARGLKAGGVLVGSVPNNSGLLGRAHTALTNVFDRTHVSTFAPNRWLELFEEAGLRPVSLFGELMLGPNLCRYITSPQWNRFSFNFMFVLKKNADH